VSFVAHAIPPRSSLIAEVLQLTKPGTALFLLRRVLRRRLRERWAGGEWREAKSARQ
jgi:hypothetical protein